MCLLAAFFLLLVAYSYPFSIAMFNCLLLLSFIALNNMWEFAVKIRIHLQFLSFFFFLAAYCGLRDRSWIKSCHSCAQNPPMAPPSLRAQAQVLAVARGVLYYLSPTPTLPLNLPKPRCSLNTAVTLWPQGLCTGCSFSLGHSSLYIYKASLSYHL